MFNMNLMSMKYGFQTSSCTRRIQC